MDIKLSFHQLVLFLGILTLVFGTTSAGHRSRGSGRIVYRRQSRREVRDYLAPPSQDASYTSYGAPALQPPPMIPYRPGRLVNPPPTEAPGYFARLASWLNPFGGSPTPPPLPEVYFPKYAQPYPPGQGYGPPSSQSYGPPVPQPPPAPPSGYLPPKGKGKNCNPCNIVPWIPMAGVAQDNHASGDTNVEVQPSLSQESKNHADGPSPGYAEEVRTPDYSHGLPPPDFSPHGHSFAGPIPYPHLYPGPMPPLFKSKPFNPPLEGFYPTPSVELDSDHPGDSILSGDGHVEVLPPGAEVDTSGHLGEILVSPPPGYEDDHSLHFGNLDDHQGSGFESGSLNAQQSTILHEDHLSTELTTGYKAQNPTSTSLEVIKSVPSADFTASVDHPIHYEQSPIIDLTQDSQKGNGGGDKDYAAGLNPPPNVSAQSYSGVSDTSKEPGAEGVKDSYGTPVSQEPPRDSSVASTVTNRTFSYPTASYGIPDVGRLPISHEAVKSTGYENYPPTTEKFLISVSDPIKNSRGPLTDTDAQRPNGSSQEEQQGSNNGKIVDSYQQDINHSGNGPDQHTGQFGFANVPEPLVPYRPSSVYVPYPPYTGPNSQNGLSSSEPSGPTTEEPFLDALLKSYENFKQEMDAKDQLIREHQEKVRTESQRNGASTNSGSSGGTTWVSQPQPSFAIPEQINPSIYPSGDLSPPLVSGSETRQQQSGGKRNKQVQIIIPYTSQYTPSPFQPVGDDWSGRGPLEQTQGRKVPALEAGDQNYVGQESKKIEVVRPLKPLENLLSKELSKKPLLKKTNNSIDVLRLQKNIDNWTIQEYARGITSSTALPSSSHPYLLPSKKIPNEYLNSNQSSASEKEINTNRPDLPGLNYNDLEHEVAASSHVDVPHVQVLTVEGASKSVDQGKMSPVKSTTTEASTSYSPSSPSSFTSTSTTTTQASWAELPVSISPHSNERVYVVTPQPVRSAKSWPAFSDFDKSGKFEAIERAYQVLPQAVNNLASTSVSGPEDSPLWGIMEHDQYARNDRENSTTSIPILYSGHSKVSNTRPQ